MPGVSNYRLSAQLRELHDMAECPDLCAYCQAIEAHDPPERGGRDDLTTFDYEDPQ